MVIGLYVIINMEQKILGKKNSSMRAGSEKVKNFLQEIISGRLYTVTVHTSVVLPDLVNYHQSNAHHKK